MIENERKARNQAKLMELYPSFRTQVSQVLCDLEEIGFRPRIHEAWRSAYDQAEAVRRGVSQVLYGFHNVTASNGAKEALAVDLVDDDRPLTCSTEFMLRLAAAAETNHLVTGIRWGLSDERAKALDSAIATQNWRAPVHVGREPLHVEISGLTMAEAKSGKRPTLGAERFGVTDSRTSSEMPETKKSPGRRYRVEEVETERVVEYELGNPLRPVALLPVPYVSQLGANADTHVNDCGAACAVMLLRAYQKTELTPDTFYSHFKLKGDPYLHASQLMSAMGLLGLQTEFKSGLTVQDLFALLAASKPVIVLLRYKALAEAGLTEKTFAGPHFVVAVGLDVKNIYLHDPLYTDPAVGEAHAYPLDIFWKAWKEASQGLEIPNPERSAIIPVAGIGFQGLRRVKVNLGVLNVRSGPGMNMSVVGTLKRGEIVEVQREMNGWGEIGFNRWILLSYTLAVA